MSRVEFYHTKAWKRNRLEYAKSKHCICERCHRPVYVSGITEYLPKEKRLKYIVHHKVNLTDDNYNDDSIALDWNNLELLCIDCHNNEHNPSSSTRKELYFDENGNLKERYTPPYPFQKNWNGKTDTSQLKSSHDIA